MNAAALAVAAFLLGARELPPSEIELLRGRLHLAQIDVAQLRATVADRDARLATYELTAQERALVEADKKARPLARVPLFDFLRRQK